MMKTTENSNVIDNIILGEILPQKVSEKLLSLREEHGRQYLEQGLIELVAQATKLAFAGRRENEKLNAATKWVIKSLPLILDRAGWSSLKAVSASEEASVLIMELFDGMYDLWEDKEIPFEDALIRSRILFENLTSDTRFLRLPEGVRQGLTTAAVIITIIVGSLNIYDRYDERNPPPQTYVVTAPSGLTVRAENRYESEELGAIPTGSRVHLVRKEGRYTLVEYSVDGSGAVRTGYVLTQYLSLDDCR